MQFAPRGVPPFIQDNDPLTGEYTFTGNGGACSVQARGRGYVFTNENGQSAYFVYVGRNRLQPSRPGQWDADIVCTVSRDRFGRTVLRFRTWAGSTSYWVSAY